MTALDDVPRPVYQAIVLGIAFYFFFLVLGAVLDEPLFILLADVYFGLLAIGIGALLFTRSATTTTLVMLSATALVLGGVAQFFWVTSGDGFFDLVASGLVFFGIAGYLIAILRAE